MFVYDFELNYLGEMRRWRILLNFLPLFKFIDKMIGISRGWLEYTSYFVHHHVNKV